MRIGIDFDDTLNDYRGLLGKLVQERFGKELNKGDTLASTIGEDNSQALVTEILETDLSLQLEPRPDSVGVLQRLIAHNHEIIILTARYDREVLFIDQWLNSRGLTANIYPTNREDKGPIARELELTAHLDDMLAQINTFTPDIATVPVLIAGGWMPTSIAGGSGASTKMADHVRSVDDWKEFESLLQTLS